MSAPADDKAISRHHGSTVTIDVNRLQMMGAKELHEFRRVLHTLTDILCGLSDRNYFFVDDGEPIPRHNAAGDYLDDIQNWLSALEEASIHVGRKLTPKTAEGVEYRCRLLASYEADLDGDLTDIVAIVAQGVKDEADARFEEKAAKRREEHPLPELPQNRVTLQ